MAPRVLVLSRSYPNDAMELSGLWVERLVRSSQTLCEPRVVAPVPYVPPLAGKSDYYARFAAPTHERRGGVDVWHPRFLVGPGNLLRGTEAAAYLLGVRRLVDRLHDELPFDLIHAHFTYPDGVAAVALGRRYGVPVVVTEHVPWGPWLRRQPLVRAQMNWAGRRLDKHVAVSNSVRAQIVSHTGRSARVMVIPNGVDGTEFVPLNGRTHRDPDRILYVGHVNAIKGVDVLLRAMKLIVARRPAAHLTLFGATYYRAKARLADDMRALAAELGLERNVEFLEAQPPREVVRHLCESAALVLPSRAESFGCVLVEALACGTPVVATRCGGPEDIVRDHVGRLVPPDDDRALAAAIEEVLEKGKFDPANLRAYALENFSWDSIAERMMSVYREALAGRA